MQLSTDVITWRIVVSALTFVCITLASILYKLFIDRFGRMEAKIDGIISYLIAHSDSDEREALSRLIRN